MGYKIKTIHGNMKDMVMERKIASRTSRFAHTELHDAKNVLSKDTDKKDAQK